ncbi:MAG: hypothetical protein IKG88_08285 [Bacteroidales bacterium]|nr:hypothetical protein [Bacteroidales bacterium]
MAAKDIFRWQQKISSIGSKRYLPIAAKEHGAFISVWVALRSEINKISLTIYPGSSMWRMLRYSCYSSKTFFWGSLNGGKHE